MAFLPVTLIMIICLAFMMDQIFGLILVLTVLAIGTYDLTPEQRISLSELIFPVNVRDSPCEIHHMNRLDNVDLTKTITCISPHGPWMYPSMSYKFHILRRYKSDIGMCTSASLLQIPLMRTLLSMTVYPINVSPTEFGREINSYNGPVVVYPGAFRDVFANCRDPNTLTLMVNRKSRLFGMIIDSKRDLVPMIAVDELIHYSHPPFIVSFFEYVHKNIVRCGLPLPVPGFLGIPLFSISKIQMLCGGPIKVEGIKEGTELCDKYTDALRNLYKEAKDMGIKTNPLKIIDYSKKAE